MSNCSTPVLDGQAQLSRKSISGTIETGTPIAIYTFDGKIVFRKPIDEREKKANGGSKASKNGSH